MNAKRLRQRIERRADAMATDLQRARALALSRLLDAVPEREIERRIMAGLPVFTEDEIARAFVGLGLLLRDGVERGAKAFAAETRA